MEKENGNYYLGSWLLGIVPLEVDRIWGIWESYYNIPKAIFYLLEVTIRMT